MSRTSVKRSPHIAMNADGEHAKRRRRAPKFLAQGSPKARATRQELSTYAEVTRETPRNGREHRVSWPVDAGRRSAVAGD